MFENLESVKKQYDELQARLLQPEVYLDAARYAKYQKESRELEPVVSAYTAYKEAQAGMASALELMDDSELGELARDDYAAAKEKKEQLEEQIRLLLLPKDPNDEKNVIMEIRSGVGG